MFATYLQLYVSRASAHLTMARDTLGQIRFCMWHKCAQPKDQENFPLIHHKKLFLSVLNQAPVAQRADNFIQWISRYSGDKMHSSCNRLLSFPYVPNYFSVYHLNHHFKLYRNKNVFCHFNSLTPNIKAQLLLSCPQVLEVRRNLMLITVRAKSVMGYLI